MARTNCAPRASMMALVSPDLMAIGKNDETIVSRSGMPKETFDAPSVMLRPNSS